MRATRWLLMLALACTGLNAYGFGMGAHAYVAWRVCGVPWADAVYAATVPDFGALGPTAEIEAQIPHLTHFEFERMEPTAFGLGFATHNGAWGADHYTHCYYDPLAPDTFFTARMRQLSAEFGFSVNKGEDVVEAVVDYMLRRDFGPSWGNFLAAAANACGPAQDQQIVDAFASRLSECLPGLAIEQAQSALRAMASGYRGLIRIYGQQLAAQELEYIRWVLVDGMSRNLGVDDITADEVMTRAEELCEGYRDELDTIAASTRNELQTTLYTLPVCGTLPLTLALAAAACAMLWTLKVSG